MDTSAGATNLLKARQVILHYLYHIEDVWGKLLLHDASAMQYVDEVTVSALELRAPRVCTRDADDLRGQVLGGIIFSAFSEQDRVGIWARLQAVDGLIPSLSALFKNLNYLKALVDCMMRLVRPSPGDTVSTALFNAFSDTNQRADRAILQVTESSFSSSPARSAERADLGVRQLYAYAMRHYLQMPRDLKGKELLARHTTNADRTVLREFADLAERLGFKSPEITALKEHPPARGARKPSQNSKPLLVTDGAGVKKKRRCGLPSIEEYVEDRESLFIHHLHNVDEEQGEGITSFFVRKSIYSAFFGKPSSLPLEEDVAIGGGQELERQKLERQELERQERERQEQLEMQERQELERQQLEMQGQELEILERHKLEMQERQELERQERERQEQLERQERERQEQLEKQKLEIQERQELERQERERQEQLERQERERQEQLEKQKLEMQERQELERQKQEMQERQELERLERQELERQQLEMQKLERQQLEMQERQELERQKLEMQKLERQQLEMQERQELERQKLEMQKLERQEMERQERQELERQKLEMQKLEMQKLERQEMERQERERQEQLEKQKLEMQERQELERQQLEMQERQELEMQEQERLKLEIQKLEKQEQEGRDQEEKAKQQQARRIQARKEHPERLQRLKLKKIHRGRPGGQAQEREEWGRRQNLTLEDERRLEDQQRIGLDELLDIDQDIDPEPGEDIHAESSGARLEEASNNTTVRINFKIRDGGIWKPAQTVERSDSSQIEKVAMNWVRGKWRLFNTELRMLAPQQCYDAVIADGTYTILLMRESEIDIDYELLLSAIEIGSKQRSKVVDSKLEEDLEEIS